LRTAAAAAEANLKLQHEKLSNTFNWALKGGEGRHLAAAANHFALVKSFPQIKFLFLKRSSSKMS